MLAFFRLIDRPSASTLLLHQQSLCQTLILEASDQRFRFLDSLVNSDLLPVEKNLLDVSFCSHCSRLADKGGDHRLLDGRYGCRLAAENIALVHTLILTLP